MPDIFETNSAGFARLANDFDVAGRRTAEAVWRTLSRWGGEFLRRVREASPVAPGGGALRASWQIAEERSEETMSVTVGTSLRGKNGEPYPLYLELGTTRIAGGRVEDWEPGEPPIELSPSNKPVERPAPLTASSATPTRLPILRPIGETIAPRVATDVRAAALNELSSILAGKKY